MNFKKTKREKNECVYTYMIWYDHHRRFIHLHWNIHMFK